MNRSNRTARLLDELWSRIAAAKATGDPDSYRFLTEVHSILLHYGWVTPKDDAFLPCLRCDTTGRVARYNPAVGADIDVFCSVCQGSGRTWNPHPEVGHPTIRGEM